MIWLLIAVIASLVALGLILPVMRRETVGAASGLSVFSGQREELRRDVDLGLVEPGEARAAELDIRRREQAALERSGEVAAQPSRRLRLAIIIASMITVMGAVLIYMQIGSPQLAGRAAPAPMADIPDEMQAVLDEVDALAADLMANPEDPRGWVVLGQAYFTLGRFDEAAIAFENAINGAPDSAYLFAFLGQAYLFAEGGEMSPRAREAFSRALDIDPQDVRARFFLAEARYQDGARGEAIRAWQTMLDEAPEDAGYRAMLETRILEAEARDAAATDAN